MGRYVDYFDSWNEENELDLKNLLSKTDAKFIVSTWFSNKYRNNESLDKIWKNYQIVTTEHFYHLGGKEENRNAMTEALILNYSPQIAEVSIKTEKQMSLFAEI